MAYLAVNKDGTEIISDNFEFDADCNLHFIDII